MPYHGSIVLESNDIREAALPTATFTGAGIMAGARSLLAVSLFVIPFGIAFGAAAAEKGLSPTLSTVMSMVVFAGASQFAALDLWHTPLPVITLLLAVLAANARHLLLGASLAPWLLELPAAQRYITLALLSDMNWARAYEARQKGETDVGFLFGGGIALWVMWVVGVAIGAFAGSGIGDLKRYGLDVVMVTFFMANLMGQWRGKSDLIPWTIAAAVALGASWLLPLGWHIVVGALAGGIVGALRHGR
jgi:4-azaleucine resistance transporter AzlC